MPRAPVRPEWQTRQEGDLQRATQPNHPGGVFGAEPGWRASAPVHFLMDRGTLLGMNVRAERMA